MPNVYLCSPTNSTMFTTCCDVAITDRESKCPVCEVEIAQKTARERWSYAYGNQKRVSARAAKGGKGNG